MFNKTIIHKEQGSKEHNQPGAPKIEEKIFVDDELVALVDPILNMDDTNRDGYIDYPEFVRAQQKQQQHQQQSQEQHNQEPPQHQQQPSAQQQQQQQHPHQEQPQHAQQYQTQH